jgi:hypothetical protein
MAITASFSGSTLSTVGDALDNSIVFSRTAAGDILVNGGAVAVTGGRPPLQIPAPLKPLVCLARMRSHSMRRMALCQTQTCSVGWETTR